jgi:hypothetical protein
LVRAAVFRREEPIVAFHPRCGRIDRQFNPDGRSRPIDANPPSEIQFIFRL